LLSTQTIHLGASLSIEALFWVPLGTGLMLLATTYSFSRLQGLEGFLNTMKQHSSEDSKKNAGEYSKEIADKSHPIHLFEIWL
jgi:hypothetical protein